MIHRLPAVCIVLLLCSTVQAAESYPSKMVRFVVPFAPGGPTDVVARVLSQRLGELWGQPVLVENRPGASGNIGASLVAKARADGYAVLLTTSAIAVNATLWPDPGYKVESDFVAVVNVASSPNIIVGSTSGPATLQETIQRAKSKGLNYGSGASGSTPHLSAEYLFKILAKVDATHIPYKGGAPALAAAVSGEVDVTAVALAAAVPLVKAGRLRGLAVTSATRVAVLPSVPTVAELGFPGFEHYTWVGVFVPSGTPASIVSRINADVNKLLTQPEVQEQLTTLGFEPVGGTQQSFAHYLNEEVAKWAKVVRDTGAKAE
jgi:tripartite-type tricarboxylate transporter receptor subunit TctC